MKLLSLAKLNLYLEILGRESDGYHNIESIMQTISLSDTVIVEPSSTPGISISTNLASLPTDEKNLAYKAAKLFMERVGWVSKGVKIILEKNIPLASGMGGGSSNAATVLTAMALISGIDLLNSILIEIASSIGCDVPFFLYGGSAMIKGKGTDVTPLPPIEGIPVLVVVPDVEVSTHWAYKNIIVPLYPFRTPSILLKLLKKNQVDVEELNRFLFNRFSDLVFRLPKVNEAKNIL
ncbi:MAG TPA: 4-(cytidine 5'-diphospho)-2-C-methyl-D-erythritol kinase, partial [bacterium]|nr:4-(cytidine 5'-diphospho)-2-C-methyl-D-erythritol kinase [bacterium]